jgi:hypothetical protein
MGMAKESTKPNSRQTSRSGAPGRGAGLVSDDKETVIDALPGRKGGANPYGSLIADKHGNLTGMTQSGSAKMPEMFSE